MDVRLPDGTVVKNVPDGTTKDQLISKLSANGMDVSWATPAKPAGPAQTAAPVYEGGDIYADTEKFGDYGSGKGTAEFVQGAASTPARVLKSTMQMLGAGKYVPQMVSKSAEVADTTAGQAGRITGDVAATLAPMGWVRGATPTLQAAKGLGAAAGRTGLAAAEGGTYGALLNPDNQVEGAMWGGVGGGGTGAVIEVGKKALAPVGNLIQRATAPLTQTGREGILRDKLVEILGEGKAGEVADYVATNARPGVSIGDLIAEMNLGRANKSGAALVKLEQVFGKIPSLADEAKTLTARQAAERAEDIGSFAGSPEKIAAAKEGRAAMTDPMREQALQDANAAARAPKMMQQAMEAAGLAPLEAAPVAAKINTLRAAKGNKANPTVQQALGEVEELLASVTGRKGTVSAEELYTIRKQAGNIIRKHADENKDWDKRFTAGLLTDVQRSIDDAIENAGGNSGQWNRYLDVFSKRSKGIGQMEIGQQLEKALISEVGAETPTAFTGTVRRLQDDIGAELSPAQMARVNAVTDSLRRAQEKKSLAANVDIGDIVNAGKSGEVHMPGLLSTPATITNFILRKLGSSADERIAKEAGSLMLTNPAKFSETYLRKMSPEGASATIEALRRLVPSSYSFVGNKEQDNATQ